MKKYLSVAVLSVATALLAFSQFGCASPQNTNTNTVSMATPEPTPDKAAIETELTKIENDWPRIIKEHDAAPFAEWKPMTQFSFIRTGHSATRRRISRTRNLVL